MTPAIEDPPCCLLLVEAALLTAGGDAPERAALEALCAYSHGQWRLLVVMNQPEQWQPTRRSMDRHLLLQQNIHEHLTRLGSHLDGVLYLPSPLLGRRQKRAAALLKVAHRTAVEPAAVWYIGGDPLNLQAAHAAGLRIIALGAPAAGQPAACRHYSTLDEALRLLPTADTAPADS